VAILPELPLLDDALGAASLPLAAPSFYRDVGGLTFALFFGAVLGGLAAVTTLPRLVNLALTPDRVYPLYGFHFWAQRTVARMTNLRFFTFLFGDSSAIVHYLKAIGYDLSRIEQTGSNFGMAVKHETPFLSGVGTGTMVSDGLSLINADFSSSSFRVSRAQVGPRNFLGNNIAFPAGGRTGDNCLLATKVMVPVGGEVREGPGCSARRRSRSPGRWSATPPSTSSSRATSWAGGWPPRTATTPSPSPPTCWSAGCTCTGRPSSACPPSTSWAGSGPRWSPPPSAC
jgi:non-ribosomal peptide synthetase-like protein